MSEFAERAEFNDPQEDPFSKHSVRNWIINDSSPLYGSIATFLQYANQALSGLLNCFKELGAKDAIVTSIAAFVSPFDLKASQIILRQSKSSCCAMGAESTYKEITTNSIQA